MWFLNISLASILVSNCWKKSCLSIRENCVFFKKKGPNGEHIKISENLLHTLAGTWRNQWCESHQHLIYTRKLSYPSNKCITLVQISIQQCLMIKSMNTVQWHALILKNYKFWYISSRLHGVTPHKSITLIFTSVLTSILPFLGGDLKPN